LNSSIFLPIRRKAHGKGVRLKENGGEGEFKYDILLRTFVNARMYSYQHKIKKKKKDRPTFNVSVNITSECSFQN
jgi:hypothetical protein